jgi:hypothetical protein
MISSFCGDAGCVDVQLTISSFCHSGGCVGVAAQADEVIVRDTKDPSVELAFTAAEWDAFLVDVKAGKHDYEMERVRGEDVELAWQGDVLRFTSAEWAAFVLGVRAGEFDLDRL